MKAITSLIKILGWEQMRVIAETQGFSALFLDSLNEDKESLARITSSNVQKQWILDMLASMVQMEQQYVRYEKTVKKLSEFASKNGIKLLFLKGYGLSLNFPIPSHRPCGDIDILVLPESQNSSFNDYQKLDSIIFGKLGITVDKSSAHHSRFYMDGILVENHNTILDPDRHKENVELNRILAEEASLGVQEVNGVLLPSFRFNSLHLLAHMAGDFASTGTNLRRLLDWATFVDRAHQINELDWDFVFSTAEHSGMSHFLNAINDICVRYLGYSSELFPRRFQNGSEASFHRLSDRVFRDLVKGPDPSLSPNQTSLFLYGLIKSKRFFKNRWKHRLVYRQPIIQSFFSLAMRNLINRKV